MLATLLIWMATLAASWGYSQRLSRRRNRRIADIPVEILASDVYLGLSIICALLFTIALVSPLTCWVGLLVLAVGMGLLALNHFQGLQIPSSKWILLCVFLLLPLALFVSTREVTFYDTGLYHQQAVKWLSSFGLVRGLALLHFRLGFTSSWFAIAATMNNGLLTGRVGAIMGGLLCALLVLMAIRIAVQSLQGQSFTIRTGSWALFCCLLLAVVLAWNIETSLSPDFVTWLLPIVTATVLTDESLANADRLGKASVVAMLGTFIKLSSLPVLGYCVILASLQVRRRLADRRRLLGWLAVTMSLGLLLCSINLRVSGCPLFPAPWFCIATDWSVGSQAAQAIRDFGSWYAVHGGPPRTEWMPLLISAALASVGSIWAQPSNLFVRHGIGIAWTGILLTGTQVPSPRFAIGYLMLPLAIAATLLACSALPVMRSAVADLVTGRFLAHGWRALAILLWITASGFAAWSLDSPAELIFPRRMAHASGEAVHIVNRGVNKTSIVFFKRTRQHGLDAWQPLNSDQCWDSNLPCTPELMVNGVALQDSRLGLAGGFTKP